MMKVIKKKMKDCLLKKKSLFHRVYVFLDSQHFLFEDFLTISTTEDISITFFASLKYFKHQHNNNIYHTAPLLKDCCLGGGGKTGF